MSQQEQGLYATVYGSEVGFPAFVHLPASARPQLQHLLSANNVESVKCLYLYGTLGHLALDVHPFDSPDEAEMYRSYRKQIASRFGIPESAIHALSIDLQGSRVLIEDDDDWDAWVYAYFFRPSLLHAGGTNLDTRKDLVIEPIHIHVIVNAPEEQQGGTTSTTTSGSAPAREAPPSDRSSNQDRASAQASGRQPSQSTQNSPLDNATSRTAQPTTPDPIAALVNNAVGSVLQALQPQLQGLPQAIISSLSAANAQRANVQRTTFPAATPSQTSNAAASSTAPATSGSAIHTSNQSNASQPAENAAQRQSLISGFVDELSRARVQSSASSAPQAPDQAGENRSATEGVMSNELGQAFAEMLARQRTNTAVATPAAASSTAVPAMDDDDNDGDESLTIVSTPSTSSRRSSRSRSRSRSRTARTTTFLSSATLLFLTLITFICTFIAPTTASVITSLNPPSDASLHARNSLVQTRHLCKCTCFQTNSTLVPLYSPTDPAKPCLTCTRQFCLDQGLEICKGAKLEHTDHDVGTGLEGDVWAKCFERDSYKDQSIITLYILVVVGLVGFAALRGRMEGWYTEYARLGPRGVLDVVRGAPWMRGR